MPYATETTKVSFNAIKEVVAHEMAAVEAELQQNTSKITLVNEISSHILSNGGKRLRPLMMILTAAACNYKGDQHIKLATILELIHAATLLHDDVIDKSTKRRNKATANFIWDNKLSILAGDFIYAMSFQKMTSIQSMQVLDILSSTTSYIVEGEIIQLTQNQDATISKEDYLEVIDRKTAKLFSVAAKLGAVLGKQDQQLIKHLEEFGASFGRAYQITNDIQDYSHNSKKTGKNIGDDLKEGKPTLPFILAYEAANAEEKKTLVIAIAKEPNIEKVLAIINNKNSIQKSKELAAEYIEQAKYHLSFAQNSTYKDALLTLCTYVERLGEEL
ncbi:MAG: polyprenyl synthetase family protein [Legionellales bacterium]|jgi:octaprenyl-diphosphate synthase|nr:polyprenyl synthetase family protein [Legionellales bacterium]